MQTFCPSCQRPLRIPDDARGAEVRCPSCQAVFRAGDVNQGEQIAPPGALPPPPPRTLPDRLPEIEPRPGRGSRLDRRDDLDDDFDEFGQSSHEALAQFRARRGGLWLTIASLADIALVLFVLTVNITSGNFGGNNRDETIGAAFAVLCCFTMFAPMAVFMLVGAGNLRTFKSRGLVITGSVMAFILGALFLVWAAINLVLVTIFGAMAGNMLVPRNLMAVMIITTILTAITAVVNLVAGVFALVGMNDPRNGARFEEMRYQR